MGSRQDARIAGALVPYPPFDSLRASVPASKDKADIVRARPDVH